MQFGRNDCSSSSILAAEGVCEVWMVSWLCSIIVFDLLELFFDVMLYEEPSGQLPKWRPPHKPQISCQE